MRRVGANVVRTAYFLSVCVWDIGVYGLQSRRNSGLENWFGSTFAAQKRCVNPFLSHSRSENWSKHRKTGSAKILFQSVASLVAEAKKVWPMSFSFARVGI